MKKDLKRVNAKWCFALAVLGIVFFANGLPIWAWLIPLLLANVHGGAYFFAAADSLTVAKAISTYSALGLYVWTKDHINTTVEPEPSEDVKRLQSFGIAYCDLHLEVVDSNITEATNEIAAINNLPDEAKKDELIEQALIAWETRLCELTEHRKRAIDSAVAGAIRTRAEQSMGRLHALPEITPEEASTAVVVQSAPVSSTEPELQEVRTA